MIQKLYNWYGKKIVLSIGGTILILALAGIGIHTFSSNETPAEEVVTKIVTTAQVNDLSNETSSVSVIGTVEAISEATIKSETSGNVTSVRVSIGDSMSVGSILATQENSREHASLLQAQGVYEAAVAQKAQNDITSGSTGEDLTRAYTTARNTYRTVFISADNIFRNTIDPIFEEYNRQILDLQEFSWERRLIRYDLNKWGERSLENITNDEIYTLLNEAQNDIDRLARFVDSLYTHIIQEDGDSVANAKKERIADFKVTLAAARATLNTTLTTINTTKATLENTKAAFERAKLSGSGGAVSLSDAQVKQALGSLRLAEAALEETIIRSPIDGVVNSIQIKKGEFINAGTVVGMVLNNNALQVTTYLSKEDRARININDLVIFDDGETGVITHIAPSVDSATQKFEVKISLKETHLSNGDVVRMTIGEHKNSVDGEKEITIPLTAVKLNAENAFVFTVVDEMLAQHAITLGNIQGNTVSVIEGITSDMNIVVDARGLTEGTKVRVTK